MDIQKKDRKLLISAMTQGSDMHEVTTPLGGPRVPKIGAKPDKATQDIPLLDLIARINFRRKVKAKPPEEPTA